MRNTHAFYLSATRGWLDSARRTLRLLERAPSAHRPHLAAAIHYAIAQARRCYAHLRFAKLTPTHVKASDGTFRATLVLATDPAAWVARGATPYQHRQSAARAALNRHNRGLWLAVCVAGSTAAGYAMQAAGLVP